MDIEGGESDALRGAYKIIKEHHPIMFVALHGEQHATLLP